MFSVCPHLGGGQVRVQPGGGVRSESSRGGVRSESSRGGVRSESSWGGGVRSVQLGGGVSILRPLAGGMPLAFTQEDFLVQDLFTINICVCDFDATKRWVKRYIILVQTNPYREVKKVNYQDDLDSAITQKGVTNPFYVVSALAVHIGDCTGSMQSVFGINADVNKKVLLRERKRHTARCVANTPYVVLTGYPPGGYPVRYPPGGYLDPPWGVPGLVPPPGGVYPDPPPGGVPGQVPWGGTQSGTPPGGYPDPPSPPMDRQTPVKTVPSRRTTYAGGNKCSVWAYPSTFLTRSESIC